MKDSTIPLPDGEATLGRDPTNAVAVADPSVSRKHCLLRREEDGRFQIKDLDSRNGTMVNGTAVKTGGCAMGMRSRPAIRCFCFCWKRKTRSFGPAA